MTRGTSGGAIYAMVARALQRRHAGGGVLLDVGCGAGILWDHVRASFDRYLGIDVVRYDGFPDDQEFRSADLDEDALPAPPDAADVVVAVETIEHLENPRRLMRGLTRAARPGGWIVVTTPNQLSLLSLATLALKSRFNAFQDVHYPAHLTPLLEVDLRRMAGEVGWVDVDVAYSLEGRIPLTAKHYPKGVSRLFPRRCSDNLLIVGKRSAD
jgi:SAM-dependent methyltransferase